MLRFVNKEEALSHLKVVFFLPAVRCPVVY